MIFTPLKHDDMGIYKSENYRLVETLNGDIVFSYTRQGKAMVIHLASRTAALRRLREAFNSFCAMIFNNYDVDMILGGIEQKSLGRMLKKCGCQHIADTDDKVKSLYMKKRVGGKSG